MGLPRNRLPMPGILFEPKPFVPPKTEKEPAQPGKIPEDVKPLLDQSIIDGFNKGINQ